MRSLLGPWWPDFSVENESRLTQKPRVWLERERQSGRKVGRQLQAQERRIRITDFNINKN